LGKLPIGLEGKGEGLSGLLGLEGVSLRGEPTTIIRRALRVQQGYAD